jgi:hypothetical protein
MFQKDILGPLKSYFLRKKVGSETGSRTLESDPDPKLIEKSDPDP